MRVACLGECMIELSEHPDGTLTRSFGGDTLNTALYLARLGIPVEYVTALGTDAFSDEMVAAWRGEGIGTGLVARVPGRLPGLYLIRTDAAGERVFYHWRDSAPVRQLFDLPETAALEAGLLGAGTIYFSGITLSLFADRERLFALLARARQGGTVVAFDTNFRARAWPDLAVARTAFAAAFRQADLVFASVEDWLPLFGTSDAGAIHRELQAAGVAEIVVKLATPACLVGGGLVEAPPVPDVIDTTAAGDSFAAAYLAARLRGAVPEAAVRAGHHLAGAVVRHRGAIIPRDAMPLPFSEAP